MKKNKIDIVYGYIVRHGGIGNYIYETLKEIKDPQRFRVLTLENTTDIPKESKIVIVDCKRDTSFMSVDENEEFSKSVKKIIDSNKHIIHSHGIYNLKPEIYTAHICLRDYFKSIEKFFGKDILKENFGSAMPLLSVEEKFFESLNNTKVIPVSTKVAEGISKNYGINFTNIIRGASKFRKRRNIKVNQSGLINVGFIGDNLYSKGLIFLKEVLNNLSNKSFNINCISAGTTHLTDLFMGDKTCYNYLPLGRINIREEFYENLDCFFCLSTYEAYSLSTLEAMSLGIPVISSNLNGVFLESNKKNSPLLTEVKDISNTKEVSNILEKIISDKEFKNKAIRQGLELSNKQSWKKVAEDYDKIYSTF